MVETMQIWPKLCRNQHDFGRKWPNLIKPSPISAKINLNLAETGQIWMNLA